MYDFHTLHFRLDCVISVKTCTGRENSPIHREHGILGTMRMLVKTILMLVLSCGSMLMAYSNASYGFSSAKIIIDSCTHRIASFRFQPEPRPKLEYDAFFNYPPSDYIQFKKADLTEKEKIAIRKRNQFLKKYGQESMNQFWVALKKGTRFVQKEAKGLMQMAFEMVATVFDWISQPVLIFIQK